MVSQNHIIVTRYSLKSKTMLSGATQEIIKDEITRSAWLAHRNDLFSKFCLPSLVGQKVRPALWILLMDISDEWISKELGLDTYDWILPLYIQSGQTGFSETKKAIRQFEKDSDNRVYKISRLDNDDMLASNFISVIAEYPEEELAERSTSAKTPFAIVAQRGCRWDGKKNIVFDFPTCPFITYLYKADDVKKGNFSLPLAINHMKVREFPHLLTTTDEPLWCQVIHDQNLKNQMIGKGDYIPPLSEERLNSLFTAKARL